MALVNENLDFSIWEVYLTGIMKFVKVEEYKGIVFEIRTKEMGHNEPHCHVSYQGKEVSISLISFEVLAGNIPNKQHKAASKWIEENIEILKKYWNSYHREIVA